MSSIPKSGKRSNFQAGILELSQLNEKLKALENINSNRITKPVKVNLFVL